MIFLSFAYDALAGVWQKVSTEINSKHDRLLSQSSAIDAATYIIYYITYEGMYVVYIVMFSSPADVSRRVVRVPSRNM